MGAGGPGSGLARAMAAIALMQAMPIHEAAETSHFNESGPNMGPRTNSKQDNKSYKSANRKAANRRAAQHFKTNRTRR